MSGENVEVVRRVFEAVARRDAEAVLALYDADIVFDNSRGGLGDITGMGVYRGHARFRRWFREFHEAWEDVEWSYDELFDAGDDVVSSATFRGRGRISGIEMTASAGGVWTVRDGKVVRVAWFPTREEALESLGLGE